MVRLSVVMSVFNGEPLLERTLASILVQTEEDFELIVVDDGSTDATADLLTSCRDRRLRVLSQENRGLTRALARGCAAATAPVVARHDCGDRSHPERFARQLAMLAQDPSLVLVSCATSYHAPGGERMYVVTGDGEDVRRSLLHDPVDRIRGLSHHGSAMFRRDAYERAGGYREELYFAQDLDLWVRLAAQGGVAFAGEVLYEARFDPAAISAVSRSEQFQTARIILQMRDEPARTAALLEEVRSIRPRRRAPGRLDEARALYFIASCLHREDDPAWKSYARRALRANPLLFRAWSLFVRGS